ncbi:MAG: hypothetical protein ABI184_01600 [Ginsengibacter sp.]
MHLTEITNLKKQIQDVTTMHETQVSQINTLKADQMKSLNEQIQTLENRDSQKDKLIEQANNLASNYQKQLQQSQSTSGTNWVAIIIALIIGIILGVVIFGRH